jgi:hypothetical protein
VPTRRRAGATAEAQSFALERFVDRVLVDLTLVIGVIKLREFGGTLAGTFR